MGDLKTIGKIKDLLNTSQIIIVIFHLQALREDPSEDNEDSSSKRHKKKKRRGGEWGEASPRETHSEGGKSMILELGRVQRKEVTALKFLFNTVPPRPYGGPATGSMDTKVLNI